MGVDNFKFVSPGIEINEIDNSQLPQAREQVGPVVIGRTKRGPSGRPVKVNSFSDYVEIFGEPVPGGKGGDVWRNGNEMAPMWSMYAAQVWLENNSPINVVRLLGEEHTNASTSGVAGWTTSGSISTNTSSNGGAYGMYMIDSASAGTQRTGTLAAVWYLDRGSIVLSGNTRDGGQTAEAANVVKSTGANREFKAIIYDENDNKVEEASFNFDRTSNKYVRKVFNTNPALTNNSITKTDNLTNYWLGETFERNVSNYVTGTTAGEQFGVVLGLEGTGTGNLSGADFEFPNQSAKTGWFFTQNFGQPSNFDPDNMSKLFRFHSLSGGEWDAANLKISIEDIKAPTSQDKEYGSFTVSVRRATDNDGDTQFVERFTGCNLDPQSPDFIGNKIGTKYRSWDSTERRYKEYGVYDNKSKFIRVEVHPDVMDGVIEPNALPYGVYGPPVHEGFSITSGSSNTAEKSSPTTTFSESFAKGGGSIPHDDTANSNGTFAAVGGKDFTGSFAFPYIRLKQDASQGPSPMPTETYFGIDTKTSATSQRHNGAYSDLTRTLPGDYKDKDASSSKYIDHSWKFTLDEVETDPNDSNNALYTSGSHVNGNSITAKNDWEQVLKDGYDKFTVPLDGGFDGVEITEKDPFRDGLVGSDEQDSYELHTMKRAIDAISDPEIIEHRLAVMPGRSKPSVTRDLIDTCRRRADSLGIIDLENDFTPRAWSTKDVQSRVGNVDNAITSLKDRGINNSYGAAYYPWVQIKDTINGKLVWVPPSVVALGTLGSTEDKRARWFAPAGFQRGGLSDGDAGLPVVNVSQKILKPERDEMYSVNMNPIAKFPAEGIVIMGQKTLQTTDSALDRVNVRRLVNHVKKGLSQLATTILFEPNVKSTWNRYKTKANNFLGDIKAEFGLQGFRVKLDEETTTPDLIDRNVMYGKVFIKPTRTIEHIGLDLSVESSGASFKEG